MGYKRAKEIMKKIVLSLLIALFTTFSAQSLCVSRTFYAYDDGEYFGKLVLSSNCSFSLSTIDGESFSGTYYIDTDELSRGSQYLIVFNLSNGRTIRTQYMWPMQGKQCIDLDGFLFEAQ